MAVEGGAFHCYLHDYETSSIADWNEHCMSAPEEHREEGTTVCVVCGVQRIAFSIPYRRLDPDEGGKNIFLVCDDCSKIDK